MKSISKAVRYLFVCLIPIIETPVAENCNEYSDLAKQGLERELSIVNSPERQAAYDAYIRTFSPDAKVHGLVPERTATLGDVRTHYRAVFFELDGGTLVEDEVYTAGPMAAHRYHSLLTLNGTFDGVDAKDKPVILRGQTFFRFGDDGRIVERWSNHDHAYRMGQLLGEKGKAEGAKLGALLNGPGLSEAAGYRFVSDFSEAFSRADAPELRKEGVSALISDQATVHGLGCAVGGKAMLMEHLDQLWDAFPDLFMTVIGKPASGWSMVAFRWRAVGSHRKVFEGHEPSGRTAIDWTGQAIMRLDSEGRAVEIWWNEDPVGYSTFSE